MDMVPTNDLLAHTWLLLSLVRVAVAGASLAPMAVATRLSRRHLEADRAAKALALLGWSRRKAA